ncbi:PAN2-PAN3 deadenylation complex subunit PAN3 [Colletotrichum liriopes]|uniref:PAN2-PAN3 deadenylation complex subunit PAN3 n=1 Tax=Colletotrichum liriopes TaxID=708192 RepID=A0AA37LZR9_9PEZI|nr:PAN2-PAN3 deadenylation complex subunit PAN3 [Colletotrichum liriopes]
MATSRYPQSDLQNKETLCRNVLIYGHCRYENTGCAFNHDQNRSNSVQNSPGGQSNQSDFPTPGLRNLLERAELTCVRPQREKGSQCRLTVIHPGWAALRGITERKCARWPFKEINIFLPSSQCGCLYSQRSRLYVAIKSLIQCELKANPFIAATPAAAQDGEASSTVFNPATFREFTPSNFELSTGITANGTASDTGLSFDPFTMPNVGQALPATPFNPYADDPTGLAGSSAAYFQHQNAYTAPLQPLQYHLYAPVGPYRDDLLPFQRQIHDFFLPEKLREEMQRKSEALQQVMPNSTLPPLDNYYSLVPLDTSHRKSSSVFGYTTWVYKATSSKSGKTYCLRRLEGFRLTNEQAIRSVKEWRRLNNGSVVTIHDAFTTRAFGDSSLFFVQDYHPLSKTLAEVHFTQPNTTHGTRFNAKNPIAESVLWGYVSQIANALKAIHTLNLAARCLDMSKVIVTDKNRIRLSACSILDVVHFEARRPVQELQQEDLIQFGKLILSLATNTPPNQLTNLKGSMEQMSRVYSKELTDTVLWLLTPAPAGATPKGIEEFIRGIAVHMVATLDASLHEADTMKSELFRELENGRLVRLMAKLGAVNERQEFDGDRAWSENGERYMLKLFRDYVFHQVDANGNPVVDMGHIIRCLNRLDAGSDDRICLTSRDEQTSFVVSYKDLKKQLGNAFGELLKAGKQPTARGFQGSSH